MFLSAAILATALKIIVAGDAFMVQCFPKEYAVDTRLKDWIRSGDARLVNFEAVEAGADAVIGGGTHQLKGIEFHRGKPIFYSLGDFVFQNNVVPVAPPDFCEQYGVPVDSDAKTAFNARSKGGKVGLHAFRENFLSVVPRLEIEDGRVTSVTMLPIELHFGCDWSVNGLPRTADPKAASDIFQTLARLSAPYGTHVERRRRSPLRQMKTTPKFGVVFV